MANTINENDLPRGNMAECYVTIGEKRYLAMMAKDFEANFSITTKDIGILGRTGKAHRAVGWDGKFKMTIYKCTPIFDEICTNFKNTGVMTNFDIKVKSNDPQTGIGADEKIYKNCTLDGDVLLSTFDADSEDPIEQEINGYYADYEISSKYTNPIGMEQ